MVAEHSPPLWKGWVTLSLLLLMFLALIRSIGPPHLVMMLTVTILVPLQILDVDHAMRGFSDDSVLSIAVLFIVAKGIELSGVLEYIAKLLFRTKVYGEESGSSKKKTRPSLVWILLQFMVPMAIVSAFVSNVPLVAMMISLILKLHRKIGMAPSQILMPLSFSVQLGGTGTLIGDSTNLLVVSLAAKNIPGMRMHLFEIGVIGVPLIICGMLYVITVSGKLLPDNLSEETDSIDEREYRIVLVVTPNSRLRQKSIKKSGLMLPGLQLVQIDRNGDVIYNFDLDFTLHAEDRLYFSGVIDSILYLMQHDGLVLCEYQGSQLVYLNKLTVNQRLFEVVVADLQSALSSKAVIAAVHRRGTRGIGDVELEAGDCLLVIAGPEFESENRNKSKFALVSQLPGFVPIQRQKAIIAAPILLGMIIANALGINLVTAGLISAAAMLITKCLTPRDAMESVDLTVIIMFAAAFGISEAMIQSGAGEMVAKALMDMSRNSEFGLIACTYVATTILSLAITNSAAVTVMFPVALAASRSRNLDFRPFAYALIMAAACALMTPTSCTTNFMIYTPGDYKFMDYIIYGGPLQLLLLVVSIGIISTLQWWWLWWIGLAVLAIVTLPLIANLPWNQMKSLRSSMEDSHESELGCNDVELRGIPHQNATDNTEVELESSCNVQQQQ